MSAKTKLEDLCPEDRREWLEIVSEKCASARVRVDKAATEEERLQRSRHYLVMLFEALKVIAGDDVVRAAYLAGWSDEADRASALSILSMRQLLAADLFRGVERRDDPASFSATANEAAAIAAGDLPKLFAQVSTYAAAYRIAVDHKLTALKWERFLTRFDTVTPADAKRKVQAVYSVSRLGDWRDQVSRYFTPDVFDAILSLVDRGSDPKFFDITSLDEALATMQRDAQAKLNADKEHKAAVVLSKREAARKNKGLAGGN
ncbi:hypothetical protein NED98_05630 [Sphingomonas sp. MMSM20]|uniref:hypothetical protein n=1 Tax=Sphingomonas lycopersici TaxID=2951807 RepID=UPI0022382B99|nr:hypothetical protein [Sphingomonas lycopersici]MCW6529720.1 hypothetical protein [Sphingomonas lycopersici]